MKLTQVYFEEVLTIFTFSSANVLNTYAILLTWFVEDFDFEQLPLILMPNLSCAVLIPQLIIA